jgi:hypothetical protein
MNNFIQIKNGHYNDIKKALRQWIDLYSNDLPDDFAFKLYKHGQDCHIIKTDERLNNELFYYLINYLNYPENIEYNINIEGFTTGKEDNILKNKKLLIYISPTDEDYDNVFVTTNDGKNYKVDFGGKITEANEMHSFKQPADLILEKPEILRVNKKEYSEKTSKGDLSPKERLGVPLIWENMRLISS